MESIFGTKIFGTMIVSSTIAKSPLRTIIFHLLIAKFEFYLQDEFVVKCPAKLQSIDGASNYSFSALTGNKIMNQTLIGRVYPPWNQEGADEWKNSYVIFHCSRCIIILVLNVVEAILHDFKHCSPLANNILNQY